ncbi:MAG: ABC transporter ATP-binding protein [Planctomycetes bacterium]|nr:ABC transporter ATP-binding protein [Planctomycetota bacterium]
MTPVLAIRELAKRFGRTPALASASLAVGEREIVALLGPTGAGKTTLLRCVAGLEAPDGGTIELGGRDASQIAPAERDIALVFQNFSLYPSMTVRENLAFPLRAPARRRPSGEVAERVAWAAKLLRIEALLERPARRLSGGEMQRVAIGRAIVRRPRLYLMDEALTNLDAKLREELRFELPALARALGTPVLWATHDALEALAVADRIVLLDRGVVLQSGTPAEVYARPASPAAARLLGWPPVNVLPARRKDGHWTAADGTRIARAAPGGPDAATLGFRPEHLTLEGGPAPAEVEVVELTGPAQVALLRWAGIRAYALVPRSARIAPGLRVTPQVAPEHVIVWPAP